MAFKAQGFGKLFLIYVLRDKRALAGVCDLRSRIEIEANFGALRSVFGVTRSEGKAPRIRARNAAGACPNAFAE